VTKPEAAVWKTSPSEPGLDSVFLFFILKKSSLFEANELCCCEGGPLQNLVLKGTSSILILLDQKFSFEPEVSFNLKISPFSCFSFHLNKGLAIYPI